MIILQAHERLDPVTPAGRAIPKISLEN
jgi:hypothetical protein